MTKATDVRKQTAVGGTLFRSPEVSGSNFPEKTFSRILTKYYLDFKRTAAKPVQILFSLSFPAQRGKRVRSKVTFSVTRFII